MALIETGRFRTGGLGNGADPREINLDDQDPVCSATRDLISESAPVLAEGRGEAALHSCANVGAAVSSIVSLCPVESALFPVHFRSEAIRRDQRR